MKNLFIGVGGTGGSTLRSLKYRLQLFNTLGGADETVEELYIDSLSRQFLEREVTDEGVQSRDISYLTLGKHDINNYVEYMGGNVTYLANWLARDQALCSLTDQELYARHAYRWFSVDYFKREGYFGDQGGFVPSLGQYRQFGRLVIDRNYERVSTALMRKIKLMEENFRVFIVFSVAGGTGAGAAFDTAMILRSLAKSERKNPSIYAFIVMGKAFNLGDTSPTYAALRELLRLGSRDYNAPYIVDYGANPNNRTVLNTELFDAKFIVDFHEGVSELWDDNLRYLGLYPSLADLMELMIEPSASRYLYEAAAKWPSIVQAAQAVQNHQILNGNHAGGQHAYQLVRQGLNAQAQHDDWFVTYKTQRIFFPKHLYLDISRNQLIREFLNALFPWREDYLLKDNLSLKTGEEISGEVLEKERNENCYDMLRSWNRTLMNTVISEDSKGQKPFHDRKLAETFDKYPADEIIESLLIKETATSHLLDVLRLNLKQDLRSNIVQDPDDLRIFLANLDHQRREAKSRFEQVLKTIDVTHKNVIRLHMARHAMRMLNTENVLDDQEKAISKGTLAFAREVFRHLMLHYLYLINSTLVARDEHMRARAEDLDRRCSDMKAAFGQAGRMRGGHLIGPQQKLVALEQESLEQVRGLEANARLIEYVAFATEEAKRWLDMLKDWSNRLVSDAQVSLRLNAERSSVDTERVLKELAMSSGVCVGLPQHELPGTRQTRSFETVRTDMGGFQQYVHELLRPEALVKEWSANFGWAADTDIDKIEDEVPEDRLIEPIVPVISMSDSANADNAAPTKIANESALCEQLRMLVGRAAGPLQGINLFTYLTDWLPNNIGMTWHDVAGEIGSHFLNSAHYLAYDVNPGLWHSYLAFNQEGKGAFIADVSDHSIGPHEHTPTEIPNYGDGNSLAFVHFAVGLTIEDSPALRQSRNDYIGHIARGRATAGAEAHDIGDIMSNHIYLEEQAMLRFEIEDLQLPHGREFTAHDLVPVELSPLFEDLDRLDLFVELYAIRLIWCERDDNDHFFWYRRDPDVTTPVQLWDRFVISRGQSLIDAARRFVANERNLDASSAFAYLPSATEMQNNLHDCVEACLRQDSGLAHAIRGEYTDENVRRISMRINLLKRNINLIEGYRDQDLEAYFDVNFGALSKRHTVPRGRLREIILHFFRGAMNRLIDRRDNAEQDWLI